MLLAGVSMIRTQLGNEGVHIFFSGGADGLINYLLPYSIEDAIVLREDSAGRCREIIPGPVMKITCDSEETLYRVFSYNSDWISTLKDFRNIVFFVGDELRACESVVSPITGSIMSNQSGNDASIEQDIFIRLSQLTLATGKLFSVVDMVSDTLIWTSRLENPFGDVPYTVWQRRNHQGHIPDELRDYKVALSQYGANSKLSVDLLDFKKPHLTDFSYNAYLLPSSLSEDPSTVIQVTVDAWTGMLPDGTPVRVSTHTKPIILVP